MVRVSMGCFAVLFLGATAMACTATPSVVDEPPPEDNVAPPDDSKPSTETPPAAKPEPPMACAKEVECPTQESAPKHGDACPCVSTAACFYDFCHDDKVPFEERTTVYANCDGETWVVEATACAQ